MTDSTAGDSERLVKSVERVRDLGEVFTPSATVQAMLDLIPGPMWEPHPSPTFLEPACGDGNFLVAVLARKLQAVGRSHAEGKLPAGAGRDALVFHGLEALSSIYAVDISPDNVVGGTPGHEIGARQRLVTVFAGWYESVTADKLGSRSVLRSVAEWIVERNVLVGNMLATNADGSSSGRDDLPLVEYEWMPDEMRVAVSLTTFGDALAAGAADSTGVMSLFDDFAPTPMWVGDPMGLRKAPIAQPPLPSSEATIGNSRRTA